MLAFGLVQKSNNFTLKFNKTKNLTLFFFWKQRKKYLFLYFYRLTVRQLIRNLGDHFNLPVTTVLSLNIDDFIDKAIKVEAGEIPSLRVRNCCTVFYVY